jgi:pimeloyl-ACP methyl ester carboxylesterase
VLDAYGLRDVHLVGMSLGGYLAQIVALKQPRRVKTLTLVASERLALTDPDIPGMDPKLGEYHAASAELDWSDKAAVVEYQVGAWRLLTGSAHEFHEALVRQLADADFDRTPDMRHAFNHATLGDADGWIGRLSEITQPALIIHGTEDQVLPYAHALALERDLPNTHLVTLTGTGHELHPADWPTILDAIERHTAR